MLSISVKPSQASKRKRDARSGETRPAVAICIEHDASAQCWVKTQDVSKIILNRENIYLDKILLSTVTVGRVRILTTFLVSFAGAHVFP